MKKENKELKEYKIDIWVNNWIQSSNKGYKAIRKHLVKNTPLYTLFGIFNAVMIYSSTSDNETVREFLFPSFFLLSILVWIVLFISAFKDAHKSKFNRYLYFLLAFILIGLVFYFVKEFIGLLLSVGAMYLIVVPLIIYGTIFNFILSRLISKITKSSNVQFIVIGGLTVFFWYITLRLVEFYSTKPGPIIGLFT